MPLINCNLISNVLRSPCSWMLLPKQKTGGIDIDSQTDPDWLHFGIRTFAALALPLALY